jgi:hypothetical protein
MSKLGPDPGAIRKPPSWLVFADDALWVELAAALERSDIRRNQQLGERLWTPLTSGSEAGSRATETWPTAKGPSRFWSGPATKPSSEIDMLQVCPAPRTSWVMDLKRSCRR